MSQSDTLSAPVAVVREPARPGRILLLPILITICILSWLAAQGKYYTAGSDFGYYMGLVGALMMVALLLYPLRKHFRFLQTLGAIRHWFRLHMIFGITGPLLIVFHSTFRIGSLNAGIAMACMLLVAGSGVIGRFIYTRIHHGLYGRKATFQELQTQLGITAGEVQSKFHFAPQIEERLKVFGNLAQHPSQSLWHGTWQLFTLGLRARYTHAQCMRDLRRILGQYAVQHGWERSKLRRRLALASGMITTYRDSVRNATQFGIYERLFSLWHILHVPFVFMLVISGIAHVIAVHMY